MSGYKRVNYYELCRLCTSSEGVKVHIFCEDGKRRQLQNKIQICLPLQVCEDDSLPKIVCTECLEKLEYFYDFRESCVTSEGMLESYFTSMRFSDDLKEGKVYIKEPDKSRIKSLPRLLQNNINTANDNNTSNCKVNEPNNTFNQGPSTVISIGSGATQIVSQNSNNNNNNNNNNNTNNSNINQNVPLIMNKPNIQITNMELISPSTVANNQAHDTATVQQQSEMKQYTQQQVMQQLMINLTRSGSDVVQYQVKEEPINERFRILEQIPNLCIKCKQIFLNNDDLLNHECNGSNAAYLIQDKIPTMVTDNTKTILETVPLDTKDKKDNCPNIISLKTSVNTSVAESNAISTQIPTITVGNFTAYNNNNSTNQNIDKQQISNATTNQQSLPQTPITSTQSKQTQNQQQSQQQQQPQQQQSKPLVTTVNGVHKCETCEKTFKRKEHLMQHRKLHSGERPFVCDVCQKSFSRKEHLLRHSISHTGEKFFVCDQCHKSFSRKDNLHKHRKTHIPSGPFICEICNKRFILKHYFLIHRMMHQHDEEEKSVGNTSTGNETKKEITTVQVQPNKTESQITTISQDIVKNIEDNTNQNLSQQSTAQIQNDNIINLNVQPDNNDSNNTNKYNVRTTMFTGSNEQISLLMQALSQQNIITTNFGQNLALVQNLIPVTTNNSIDLSQLINNRINVEANTINVANNVQINQQKHTLNRNNKFNTKIDSKELENKNIITPILNQVGNNNGIILLPTKNQNFVLNTQDLLNKTIKTQPQQINVSTSNTNVIEPKVKKIKYSQSGNNSLISTNNTPIVTNLSQISAGKSNLLFSSTSSNNINKNKSMNTTVISNTLVNSLNQNNLFTNEQQISTSTSNAQYI